MLTQQPLPYHIIHRIDANSPLYGMNYDTMVRDEVEVICVFDAIDELTSANFQVLAPCQTERVRAYVPAEMELFAVGDTLG